MALINDAVADLITKLKLVPAVADKIVTLYSQDELVSLKTTLKLPALAVIYAGSTGKDDTSKTGKASDTFYDIVLMGAERCEGRIDSTLSATGLSETVLVLEQMRSQILCTLALGNRKWQFVSETPLGDFSEEVMAYRQRWKLILVFPCGPNCP